MFLTTYAEQWFTGRNPSATFSSFYEILSAYPVVVCRYRFGRIVEPEVFSEILCKKQGVMILSVIALWCRFNSSIGIEIAVKLLKFQAFLT